MLSSLLVPATDRGVLVQAIATIVVALVLLVLVRRHSGPRLFVVGIGLVALGLQALRAVH